MNRVFLLGNGFDLAHGLKTSYNDFIIYFVRNYFGTLIEQLKKRETLNLYSDEFFEIQSGVINYELFDPNVNRPEDEYIKFVLASRITIKVDFLGEILSHYKQIISNQETGINWFDVEQVYYRHLHDYAGKNADIDHPNAF